MKQNSFSYDLGSYILLGTSQSGKSSTINTISGNNIAEIGKGDGSSCTTTTKRYDIESNVLKAKINLIDFPGFLDSDLKLTDEQIIDMLKSEMSKLISEENSFNGFMLFESMGSDSSNLLNSLEKLCSLCGLEVKRSTIVIINKIDYEDGDTAKSDFAVKLCNEQKIPFVKWTNQLNNISAELVNKQFDSLRQGLSNLEVFHSGILARLEEEIMEIAKKLRSEQKFPKLDEIMSLAIEMSNRSMKVPEIRIKSELVNVVRTYNCPTNRRQKNMGTGSTKTNYQEVSWVEQEVKTIRYTEMVQKGPQAFMKLASKALEPKPIEDFIPNAAAIKADEIKRKLLANSFRLD
ncbi:hypothetical protein SteCoe_23439 [Stentor coeruleus]|uniref:AIG1-type G domain-containing protein n=1 Tax=Stentor coeruleus TaxID=5963 RepID=A0A1R2BJY5_9CILI|nr:hypothetical protein SteCoe_23439 [Stentor coeruleus]